MGEGKGVKKFSSRNDEMRQSAKIEHGLQEYERPVYVTVF